MATAGILTHLLKVLDIPVRKFERKIDVPYTTIVRAIERDSELKAATVDKIIAAFPQVSRDALIANDPDGLINTDDEIKKLLKQILQRLDSIEKKLSEPQGKKKTIDFKPKKKAI